MNDMRRLMTLVESGRSDVLVNPSRPAVLRLLKRSFDVARMAVDDSGNVYIWDASAITHSDFSKRHHVSKTGVVNRLTALSLYAFHDGIAARVYEVEDEQEHPELTFLARQLPNIVRIWGPDVMCIDIHGEP